MNKFSTRNGWRVTGGAITALLLLMLFTYRQSVLYLIDKWNDLGDGDYGHGYLVLIISIYLIFYNRQRLLVLRPCPEYRAILAIVFSSMIWTIAVLVDIAMLQSVGLLLLVLSIVWVLLGAEVTKILIFPVLFIGFAIPIWFPLATFLQELTANVVFWAIRVLEIPALRIENMIVLPSGKLLIEEACAGLRYLMAALTLGSLYAYLNYRTFHSRLVVVLFSAGVAVLANIVRVFIVVYLGFVTEMQHPLVHDHVYLGWYLFGGLVVVLLVIDVLLNRRFINEASSTRGDYISEGQSCDKGKLQFSLIVLVAAIMIILGPATVYWIENWQEPVSHRAQIQLSLDDEKWSILEIKEDDWEPQYRGAISHKVVLQDKSNHKIYLYMGLYPTQTQGEELINDNNKISDDEIWSTRYQRARVVEFKGQRVLEQSIQKDNGSRRLVWYWYHVAGQDTVNNYQAKALQVLGLFNGRPQASIVAIAAKVDGQDELTRDFLAQFMAEMGGALNRAIDVRY